MESITLTVASDDTVQIEGRVFDDRFEIGEVLKKIHEGNPDLIFVIDPGLEVYYVGVAKIIYGGICGGVPEANFRYKNPDGSVVKFLEGRSQ